MADNRGGGDNHNYYDRRHPNLGDNGVSNTMLNLAKSIIQELFPAFASMEVFMNNVRMTKQSIMNSPCTSIFYGLIALLGIFPVLCFLLSILGIIVMGLVCFMVSQVTLFLLAAMVFGFFLFFVLSSSFFVASSVGVAIHMVYSWRWLKMYLTDNWRDILYSGLGYAGRPGRWMVEQLEYKDRVSDVD